MIASQNITNHELVGLYTEIVESSNPQIIGLSGRVVDETKSMIIISTEKGTKSIAKSQNNWKFLIDNNEVIVNGSKITKRPFDRLGAKT